MKKFTDYELFKLQEFKDFVTAHMHPIVPMFEIGYLDFLYIRFKKPNQPENTITQMTLGLDIIFENDILISIDMFKKMYQEILSS
jgi:hypothetical protein